MRDTNSEKENAMPTRTYMEGGTMESAKSIQIATFAIFLFLSLSRVSEEL
jgi:hypothetical protein